jgi:hypothetical protein
MPQVRSDVAFSGGLCCKSRFAPMIKNSTGRRRGFRVKTGDLIASRLTHRRLRQRDYGYTNRRLLPVLCFREKFVTLQLSTFATQSGGKADNRQGRADKRPSRGNDKSPSPPGAIQRCCNQTPVAVLSATAFRRAVMMRTRAGLQANSLFVPSPSRPGTVLRGEHLKMADEVVTRFKSVKLHHYWPCTVCGGQRIRRRDRPRL